MGAATAAEIARVREGLDRTRAALLAAAEGLNEPAFSTRPRPGEWSAAHVCEHLARAERAITAGAKRVVDTGRSTKPQWHDPLRMAIFRSGLPELIRVRTSASLDPPDAPPREEALARLAGTRSALLELLASLEGRDLAGLYLRHPYFGAFPLLDMLAWIGWHEDRHRRQIERIRRALGA